ncbi:MAG: hypothetical protein AAGE65_12975 [Planctomycetota bacterium]
MTRAVHPNLEDAPPEPARPVSPWTLGLAAARRNAVPAVFLALFALSLGLSYAWVPAVRQAFDTLAAWRNGLIFPLNWLFPVASTAVFGAVIPWVVQRLRPDKAARPSAKDLMYFSAFWGLKGAEIHLLYLVLDAVVGSGAALSVVALKIVLDMGFYCPIWAVPTTLVAYQFRDKGFVWSAVRDGPLSRGLAHWYRWSVLPVVVNNWCVWVPAVMVIYTMPLALQLPFQNLVLCFWALVMAFMSDALSEER